MYAGLLKILGEKFYITIQPEILQKKLLDIWLIQYPMQPLLHICGLLLSCSQLKQAKSFIYIAVHFNKWYGIYPQFIEA